MPRKESGAVFNEYAKFGLAKSNWPLLLFDYFSKSHQWLKYCTLCNCELPSMTISKKNIVSLTIGEKITAKDPNLASCSRPASSNVSNFDTNSNSLSGNH